MKITRIAIGALLLAVVLQAQAASLSTDGRGQVLLFPFITSENDWDTYLGIKTAPAGGNIVRLRFLGARDGNLLHTFTIYSAEGEDWRAAVTQAGDGSLLRIAEGSCTLADSGQFGGPGDEFPLAAGVMMLEAYAVSLRLDEELVEAPCAELAARWDSGGDWRADPDDGLEEDDWVFSYFSEGYAVGIAGYFDLVNVEKALSATLPATPLRNVMGNVPHTAPDAETPNLMDADAIVQMPDGTTLEPASGEGIDAVAMVLAVQEPQPPGNFSPGVIANDVITAKGVNASTDWIVTLPLRGYRTYGDVIEYEGEVRQCDPLGAAIITENFVTFNRSLDRSWSTWGEGVMHNGRFSGIAIDPVPPLGSAPFLCSAVNVLTFGDSDPIFLSEDAEGQYRAEGFRFDSWSDVVRTMEYRFLNFRNPPHEFRGRPVLGFRATTFVNNTLGGSTRAILSNYMTLREHDTGS